MKHKHYCINPECDKYRNEEDIKHECNKPHCFTIEYTTCGKCLNNAIKFNKEKVA